MKRAVFIVLVSFLDAAACSAPRASAPPARAFPAPIAPPPRPAVSAHAAPRPRWALAYERACLGSLAEPHLDTGGRFSYCGALFELEDGRFLGPAPSERSLERRTEPAQASGAQGVMVSTSARGARAILAYAAGEREIVTLPERRRILALPPLRGRTPETPTAALDEAGRRVAFVAGDGVHVAELCDGELVPFTVESEPLVSEPMDYRLAFSADGKSLFAWTQRAVQIFREDEQSRPRPRLTYPRSPPPGFRSASFRGSELTFSRFDEESESVGLGLVLRLRSSDAVDVWVFALDSRELDANDVGGWARAALLRYEHVGGELSALPWSRITEDARGRTFEYANFVRDGCAPRDHYVRMAVRQGVLYRILLAFPPGTPPASVLPRLNELFDVPFREPDPGRALPKAPPGSPC